MPTWESQGKSKEPKEPLWLQLWADIPLILRDDETDSYAYWADLSKEVEAEFIEDYCMARAYTSHDGLYEFCHDVMGFRDLYEPLHRHKICNEICNPDTKRAMLMVNRGAFKSSIATIGYSCWLIARETTLLHSCNIRILIGSESLSLCNAFASSVNATLRHNPDFIRYFGRHYPQRQRGRRWRDNAFVSAFRTEHGLKEHTVETVSPGASKSGFHYDVVLADDLQAERNSSSIEQINVCWNFYQLLHSLLEPTWPDNHPMWTILPAGPHFRVTGTRWHFDDIYQRIEAREKRRPEGRRGKIIYIPVMTAEGVLNFPTRFSQETIEDLRIEHGPEHFSNQYMLNPTPMETRVFRSDWIQTTPAEVIAAPHKYGRMAMGSDWAYTEKNLARSGRGSSRRAAYTVHLAGVMSPDFKLFITHAFRGQVTANSGIEELFSLYEASDAFVVGLQKYDASHIEDVLKRRMRERRQYLNLEWITYPSNERKHDRIKTNLQEMFERRRVFLPPNCRWLEAELIDFPNSLTFDGLDAMCNLVKVAKPPSRMGASDNQADRPVDTLIQRKVRAIRGRGKVLSMKGRSISGKRASSGQF